MDRRRIHRNTLLAAVLLAGGAAVPAPDPFATTRQVFRFATQLIRVDAPEAPATLSITTGVRG